MGEKREREAKENFTLIIVAGLVVGAAFTVFGLLFLEEIVLALGATPSLYGYCCDYLRVLLAAALPAVFQMLFQTFFVTAGKPALGLVTTIIGGCVNVVFDYVFIKLCGMGVTGAAIATSMATPSRRWPGCCISRLTAGGRCASSGRFSEKGSCCTAAPTARLRW